MMDPRRVTRMQDEVVEELRARMQQLVSSSHAHMAGRAEAEQVMGVCKTTPAGSSSAACGHLRPLETRHVLSRAKYLLQTCLQLLKQGRSLAVSFDRHCRMGWQVMTGPIDYSPCKSKPWSSVCCVGQACAELQRAAQALLRALEFATALALRGAEAVSAAAAQLSAAPLAEQVRRPRMPKAARWARSGLTSEGSDALPRESCMLDFSPSCSLLGWGQAGRPDGQTAGRGLLVSRSLLVAVISAHARITRTVPKSDTAASVYQLILHDTI